MPADPEIVPPPLAIQPRRLLGPGPSNVHPSVVAAMAQPVVGHMDPQFLAVMAASQGMLRRIFGTENPWTLPVSGTGSAGMEAALVNLIEPGDSVLVASAGYFADRMAEMAGRLGAEVHRVERPWGEVFSVDDIAAACARWPATGLVAIVHGETSTGTLQPLSEIGRWCRESGRLFLVDAVATLGGVPLHTDAWEIDACYSGSQKCLSAPPGLAPLTFGPRAAERVRRRRGKVASWYFDLNGLETYWTSGQRAYHHTAPIAMNYALYQAARRVLEEGLPARWRRHQQLSDALVAGLATLGFRLFAAPGCRLPVVNAVWLPAGLDDGATRKRLLEHYGIEVAGGLGPTAGKIWRVGLMGDSCTRDNVFALLAALEETLAAGGGVSAAEASLAAPAAEA